MNIHNTRSTYIDVSVAGKPVMEVAPGSQIGLEDEDLDAGVTIARGKAVESESTQQAGDAAQQQQ